MNKDSILVVEDEAIVAMDISNVVESLGYDVLSWLKSGEEALDFLTKKRPDLILMDIKLKGDLDGIQTADTIRRLYDLPVIFLTAFSDRETLDRAKVSLPYGYITKSFNINDLRSTMEMALYKHRMERKLREQQQVHELSLNNIHAAVLTTDDKGDVRFYNRAASGLFDIDDSTGVGKSIDMQGFELICSDGTRYKPSGIPVHSGKQGRLVCTCSFQKSGKTLPVECRVESYEDERGTVTGYVYVFRDITEEIQSSELKSRLASIVEYSDDAVISLSLNGQIQSWNSAATRIFGFTPEEVIGKNFIMLTPSFLPEKIPELLEDMRDGTHHDSFETIRKRKDGTNLPVSLMVSPIRNQEGVINEVSVIARDISEKRNLETRILEVTEKERIRIGQDLHDSLGQHLTGVLLNMKILENELIKADDASYHASARRISDLVREAIRKTKDLAKNLAPPIIESEGIREALRSLVSTTEEIYHIKCVLQLDAGTEEPTTAISLQIYRIAQEAVHNAVKHAESSEIQVELKSGKNEIVLLVSDNGKGIRKKTTGGMGISIMNYRADMINGTLTVDSGSKRGTRIICRVPLQKDL